MREIRVSVRQSVDFCISWVISQRVQYRDCTASAVCFVTNTSTMILIYFKITNLVILISGFICQIYQLIYTKIGKVSQYFLKTPLHKP
jgi:hypothetical protein